MLIREESYDLLLMSAGEHPGTTTHVPHHMIHAAKRVFTVSQNVNIKIISIKPLSVFITCFSKLSIIFFSVQKSVSCGGGGNRREVLLGGSVC